jgi:hypothetical protein
MSPRFLRTFLAAALFPLAFAAYAADGPPPERADAIFRYWELVSMLVGGIGADVRITPTSISFYAGRPTYGLRYVGEVTTEDPPPDWHTRTFSLFEVSPPSPGADVDQLICHDRDADDPQPAARYLAIGPARWQDEEQLTIVAFTTEGPPADVAQSEGHCTTMTYALPPPQPPEDRAKAIFERDWIARTTTAMGVTGDLYLTPTTIDFARRASFRIRYIGETSTPNPYPYWHTRDFALFEILDPRPLPILRRNELCGSWKSPDSELPRYIAVGLQRQPGETDELLLLVFNTARAPADVADRNGLCGEYGYFTKSANDGGTK